MAAAAATRPQNWAMPWHPDLRTVASVPEHEESLDALERQDDRRDAWSAVVITAIALAVMLVASLLVVVSTALG